MLKVNLMFVNILLNIAFHLAGDHRMQHLFITITFIIIPYIAMACYKT